MPDLKEEARSIFLSALESISIEDAISRKLSLEGNTLKVGERLIDLSRFTEVVLIGFGKCSLRMGGAVEKLLGERIKRGLLVTDRLQSIDVRSEVIVAGHPLPNSNSLKAGKKIIELVESCRGDSLIVFLVSGGGSALVELPITPDISLEDLQALNHLLIRSGASIGEINTIRKCVSQIKGGKLGRLLRGSRSISLYVSDVNPGDLRSIASNPLLPEHTRFEDFISVLDRFNLVEKLPSSIVRAMGEMRVSERAQEYGADDNLLLLENRDALEAAGRIARAKGFKVEIDYEFIEGRYEMVFEGLKNKLDNLKRRHPRDPVCVVSGGEVSCPVKGDGAGGRNQEFVLYSAAKLAVESSEAPLAVLSCGTDGIDGNSSAAGAVADADTIRKGAERGFDVSDYLKRNDSYTFFREVGGLVITGPTGNNVRDVRLLLASPGDE